MTQHYGGMTASAPLYCALCNYDETQMWIDSIGTIVLEVARL